MSAQLRERKYSDARLQAEKVAKQKLVEQSAAYLAKKNLRNAGLFISFSFLIHSLINLPVFAALLGLIQNERAFVTAMNLVELAYHRKMDVSVSNSLLVSSRLVLPCC